jgi:hypothetical protein
MALSSQIATSWLVVLTVGHVRLVNLAETGPVAVRTRCWATVVRLPQRDKGPVWTSAPYYRTWFRESGVWSIVPVGVTVYRRGELNVKPRLVMRVGI